MQNVKRACKKALSVMLAFALFITFTVTTSAATPKEPAAPYTGIVIGDTYYGLYGDFANYREIVNAIQAKALSGSALVDAWHVDQDAQQGRVINVLANGAGSVTFNWADVTKYWNGTTAVAWADDADAAKVAAAEAAITDALPTGVTVVEAGLTGTGAAGAIIDADKLTDALNQINYILTGQGNGTVASAPTFTVGGTKIKVTLTNGTATKDVELDFTYDDTSPAATVTGVTIALASGFAATIFVGQTTTLVATVTMDDGSVYGGNITWNSTVSANATVASGVVTAVAAGSTNITATAGGVTSSVLAVTVEDYTVAGVSNPPAGVTVGSTTLDTTGNYHDADVEISGNVYARDLATEVKTGGALEGAFTDFFDSDGKVSVAEEITAIGINLSKLVNEAWGAPAPVNGDTVYIVQANDALKLYDDMASPPSDIGVTYFMDNGVKVKAYTYNSVSGWSFDDTPGVFGVLLTSAADVQIDVYKSYTGAGPINWSTNPSGDLDDQILSLTITNALSIDYTALAASSPDDLTDSGVGDNVVVGGDIEITGGSSAAEVAGDIHIVSGGSVTINETKGTEVSGSIVVEDGGSLTISAGTEISGSVTVEDGGALAIGAATEVSGTVTVDAGGTVTVGAGGELDLVVGTLEVGGDLIVDGGTIKVDAASVIELGEDAGVEIKSGGEVDFAIDSASFDPTNPLGGKLTGDSDAEMVVDAGGKIVLDMGSAGSNPVYIGGTGAMIALSGDATVTIKLDGNGATTQVINAGTGYVTINGISIPGLSRNYMYVDNDLTLSGVITVGATTNLRVVGGNLTLAADCVLTFASGAEFQKADGSSGIVTALNGATIIRNGSLGTDSAQNVAAISAINSDGTWIYNGTIWVKQ